MHSTDFWSGQRVLVTGHTGFKGGWLCQWLLGLGAEPVGFSLPAESPSMFEQLALAKHMDSRTGDIRNSDAFAGVLEETSPDVVFHLAAQSLVRRGYREPADTFDTNVMGTVNLLEALRQFDKAATVIIVTSDKCYENNGAGEAFSESDPLGGHDPYSASKAAAEMVAHAYQASYGSADGLRIASARAGNVIGGGDFAEDRLIPDVVRAVVTGEPLKVRNPGSTRPWQHVLDPLAGYLQLAEHLDRDTEHARAYNFGPPEDRLQTVGELLDFAREAWPAFSYIADPDPGPAEAATLQLDASLAADALDWSPRYDVAHAMQMTIDWYRRRLDGENAIDLTVEQIEGYAS